MMTADICVLFVSQQYTLPFLLFSVTSDNLCLPSLLVLLSSHLSVLSQLSHTYLWPPYLFFLNYIYILYPYKCKSDIAALIYQVVNPFHYLSWFCPSAGGYFAGSLAVMTDAAHLLVDLTSFIISLLSLWLSSRPATHKLSYGWHRAGTFITGCVFQLVCNLFELFFILFIPLQLNFHQHGMQNKWMSLQNSRAFSAIC